MGVPGSTSVSNASASSSARTRWAPISQIRADPGERPVVSRSSTTNDASASEMVAPGGTASPTDAPRQASRASPVTTSSSSERAIAVGALASAKSLRAASSAGTGPRRSCTSSTRRSAASNDSCTPSVYRTCVRYASAGLSSKRARALGAGAAGGQAPAPPAPDPTTRDPTTPWSLPQAAGHFRDLPAGMGTPAACVPRRRSGTTPRVVATPFAAAPAAGDFRDLPPRPRSGTRGYLRRGPCSCRAARSQAGLVQRLLQLRAGRELRHVRRCDLNLLTRPGVHALARSALRGVELPEAR